MANFDELQFDEASAIVAKNLSPDAATNKAFAEGNHWQNKDGWIGPSPAESDSDGTAVWTEIEEGFVSKNAIAEVRDRHADAVISQEPDWNFTVRRPLKQSIPDPDNPGKTKKETPNDKELALIQEAEAVLVEWWDARRVLRDLQRAVKAALIGERACLRLYVPQGLLKKNGNDQPIVPLGKLDESFQRLFLEVVEAQNGAIEPDPDTQMDVGAYLFSEKENITDPDTDTKNFAELHYLDEARRAVIRRASSEGNDPPPITLNLGGRIAFYEIELPSFITAQVRSNQKALNMELSMMARNGVLGGFLERVLLNAQLPGTWETDTAGKKTFVPAPFSVGAGTTNVLMGAPLTDPVTGKITGYTTPSVIYRDPIDPTSFIKSKAEYYQCILEEVKQSFVLMSSDATASGESRKQAERDFQRSLRATVTAINDAGRWLLETALAMAANFSGQPERFAELRAVFNCKVDVDELSGADIDNIIKLKKEQIIAPDTAMVRARVDDPDAEQAKIDARMAANAAQQNPDPMMEDDPALKEAA